MTAPSLKSTLLPHQETGVEWCLKKEATGCILADDMGLGKTVTTCAVLVRNPMRTLIVAPLALLGQWQEEISRHTQGIDSVIYWGPSRKKDCNIAGANVVITNYETIVGETDTFASGFARLVVDEAHIMRNRRSKLYEKMRNLFADADIRKIFLTGTPICNTSADLIALVTLLKLDNYSNPDFWRGIHITKEIEALHDIRTNAILRRTKEEVFNSTGLPKKEIRNVPIKLEDSAVYLKEYNRLKKKMMKPVIAKILRLRQCVNQISLVHDSMASDPNTTMEYGGVLPTELSAKLAYVRDTISAIPADDKIVIFSQWTGMLDHVYNVCTELGIGSVMYHGKQSACDKRNALDAFRSDDAVRVILVSLKAGGCGLNLCVANHVIITEPYFNAAEEKQAIDRVYRIGQTKDVVVHRLYVPNTVESWMLQLQKMKSTISTSVLSGADTAAQDITQEKEIKKEMFHKLVQ